MTFNELIENVKGWSTAKELDMVDGVFVKDSDLEEGQDGNQ